MAFACHLSLLLPLTLTNRIQFSSIHFNSTPILFFFLLKLVSSEVGVLSTLKQLCVVCQSQHVNCISDFFSRILADDASPIF